MILGFCGTSNTGKTTMIEKLTKDLVNKGFKVSVVKHTHHSVDLEGKDSARFRSAGAMRVILYGDEIVEFRERDSLFSTLKALNSTMDVVLVEGFKKEKFIKKVCMSEGCENCVFSNPEYDKVMKYILESVEIEKIERKLPGFNCGECGHRNCHEMAKSIHAGKNEFKDCRYWNPNAVVAVNVNGKDIYMGKFAQDILVNTLIGLLSSFKGVKNAEEVNIHFKLSK